MADIAIQAEHLGKEYVIGGPKERYLTLRDSLVAAAKSPFRRFRPSSSKIWALKDVSFEIKQGEAVGIIGRNGAGKSTLLKVLSRITEPTEGTVRLKGRVASLLEVGTGFHPELTGRENIYLNGAILGMTKTEIKGKFDEIVDFAEIEKFLDTPVKRYSSGMYMRLAFAVAAHLQTETLLVDEILAVGDAQFQKKCLGKIQGIATAGRTVLFVSHNMAAIQRLCSDCLLLDHGALAAAGPSKEVVQTYLDLMDTASSGDLQICSEREGLGLVRFTSIEMIGQEGKPSMHAVSGQPLTIVLHYASRTSEPINNPRIGISVYDSYGNPLFVCSTEMGLIDFEKLPPTGAIALCLPCLPLSTGKYMLTLFFETNHVIQDWLRQQVPLYVEDGDFFGSGKNYPDGWAGRCVLVEHEWRVSS